MLPAGIKNPPLNDKEVFKQAKIKFEAYSSSDSDTSVGKVLDTERDIATQIISVHDDPTLNPWTLRAFIVGLGLSTLSGVLGKSVSLVHLNI